jgi:hypothetical protein
VARPIGVYPHKLFLCTCWVVGLSQNLFWEHAICHSPKYSLCLILHNINHWRATADDSNNNFTRLGCFIYTIKIVFKNGTTQCLKPPLGAKLKACHLTYESQALWVTKPQWLLSHPPSQHCNVSQQGHLKCRSKYQTLRKDLFTVLCFDISVFYKFTLHFNYIHSLFIQQNCSSYMAK